ncbi:kielin/chordin-like protein [Hylaeus anthracinus]|uniref:kielin/chordin-like protein n=1 Tax=Hylaeus anthracinus TaxID=313031 RepID=UPI0023B886D5|nr:kielin/chordin-like protein [Hylaeus anthracinus]
MAGSFVQKCVYLTFVVAVYAAPKVEKDDCDKSKCPGPVRYYEELGCTPVYKNPGDCCAEKYDCSSLKALSTNKCYVNGHEYSIGEKLKDEDANPCDILCSCRDGYDGVASFNCAVVDCPFSSPSPDCHFKPSHNDCCSGSEEICFKEEERPTCEVDGKTYTYGDYFVPESEPDKECYCMEGYKGENIEPFCKKPNRPHCSPLFRGASDVHRNCVPVFYSNQDPRTDCSVFSRCQNQNDTVIHNHDSTKSLVRSDEDMCKFGDMMMHVGDELNQGTDYDSVCVRCVCDVPPIPTCQRLPDDECDVTKHEPFHNLS